MKPPRLPAALEGAGWPGLAGALALVLALLLAGVLAPSWRAEADAGRQAAQRVARQAAQQAARAPAPPPAPAEAPLPDAEHTPERAAALLDLAPLHDVNLRHAREQTDAGGQLQLGMTGQASYAALRAFVAAALAADPALVLERVRLQRPTPAAAELEIDLQWTLLQRAAASGPATVPPTLPVTLPATAAATP